MLCIIILYIIHMYNNCTHISISRSLFAAKNLIKTALEGCNIADVIAELERTNGTNCKETTSEEMTMFSAKRFSISHFTYVEADNRDRLFNNNRGR